MGKSERKDKNTAAYFPVAIITCNRIGHLRECIESLSRCTHADKTELYISVDYPPDESYVEGWEEVKEYLADVKGFKKVNVWIQETNLGPQLNVDFVQNRVCEKYAAWVLTEDDNVFAPAFLDYMNQMLCRYEKDPKVYSIAGFNLLKAPHNARIFKNYAFQPWGYGVWKDKWDYLCSLRREEVYEKHSKKLFKIISLYFRNKWIFCVYVGGLIHGDNKGQREGVTDVTLTLLYYLLGLYSVFPAKSLVKNNGFDGSGINCRVDAVPHINEVELDEELLFCYDPSRKVPVTWKRYLPIPEWARKSARLKNDPLAYALYCIMGKEKYLEWRKRKGI